MAEDTTGAWWGEGPCPWQEVAAREAEGESALPCKRGNGGSEVKGLIM